MLSQSLCDKLAYFIIAVKLTFFQNLFRQHPMF